MGKEGSRRREVCDRKRESVKEWVCVKALLCTRACMRVSNQMRKKCVLVDQVAIIHKDKSGVKLIRNPSVPS